MMLVSYLHLMSFYFRRQILTFYCCLLCPRRTVTDNAKGDDPDALLSQKHYSKALGNVDVDPQYIKFMTRIQRGGEDQVIRYCRWNDSNGAMLPMTSLGAKILSSLLIPDCSCCGAARKFEFQVS